MLEQNKKNDDFFFSQLLKFLKVWLISRQMTMILMYVSIQTVQESAIEI